MANNPKLMDLNLGTEFLWNGVKYKLIDFHSRMKHPMGTAACVQSDMLEVYRRINKEARTNQKDLFTWIPLTDYVKIITK